MKYMISLNQIHLSVSNLNFKDSNTIRIYIFLARVTNVDFNLCIVYCAVIILPEINNTF